MPTRTIELDVPKSQPAERSRQWLTLVDSLVPALRAGGPLTFVLGAGASISSGGPTTESIEKEWLSALDFTDAAELHEKITQLGHQQKIDPIRPLFESIKPFIGYHCLASLARERPILVINLNWDEALERACESVSVPYFGLSVDTSDELTGEVEEVKEHLNAAKPGVYCLHVHGRLKDTESSIRFGLYDTLKFADPVMELIDEHFFTHPVVVVGASLQGEYDVIDLLRGLTDPTAVPASAFYIFSRQEERKQTPNGGLMQNVLFSRKSELNFRGDPAVDFDRLMLDLATRLKGIEVADAVKDRPEMIPRLEKLAIPSRAVLGSQADHADRYAIVIEGDARIGKTNAAFLLAHLAYLCDEVTPQLTHFSGSKQCTEALEAFIAADAAEVPSRVLILEDPFGEGRVFDEDSTFMETFQKYLEQRPDDDDSVLSSVIVTVRASKWRMATKNTEFGSGASVRSVSASDWYENDELEAYLQGRMKNDAPLRREIHKRELATPMAIEEAIAETTDGRLEMVAEKVAFLKSLDHEVAWYALRARLQELWPKGMSEPPLHGTVGSTDPMFAEAALMLREKALDGRRYVIPARSVDREAIDEFFADNEDDYAPDLKKLEQQRGNTASACELWRAIGALRKGKLERMEALPEEVQLDWGPMFMGEAARAGTKDIAKARVVEVMERLRGRDQSEWSYRELVFEMIRLWPLLRKEKQAQKFLDKVLLDNKRMGRYLVVESMLYVQAATYPNTWDLSAYAEVWDKLAAARHDLLHAPDKHAFELAMLFDAFTWCPPRLEPNELRRWLDPLIEAAEGCSPMSTAIQFSCFYHSKGAAVLRENGIATLPTDSVEQRLSAKDADAAARIIRWHFIHQSRVRAMLYRRDMEPLHAHLISRVPMPDAEQLSRKAAEDCERMVRALAGYSKGKSSSEHAGWAVHLAMSIATTRTGFDPGCMAPVIGKLDKRDPGLITGVLTYGVPEALVVPVVAYFSDEENRDALLAALENPLEVDGVRVGPPLYCAARPARHVYEILREHWAPLVSDGLPVDDEYEFLELVHSAAAAVKVSEGDDRPTEKAINDAVEIVVCGDLRRLQNVPLRETVTKDEPTSPEGRMADRLRHLAREIEEESPPS